MSESRIDVSWQDNSSNEAGFEVHRSTTGPTGTFTLRTSLGAGVTTHADVSLAPSSQYCYKVRAFRVAGNKTSSSGFSTPACATTPAPSPPPGPPDAPSQTDAVPAGSNAVELYWLDHSANEDGFRIERSIDGGLSWMTAATRPAAPGYSPWWLDEGRTSEVQVCYRLIAFNGKGESAPSNVDCATPPAGPTDLIADAECNLTWTDNSAVEDGYEIWIMDAWGPTYDGVLATLPPNATTFSPGSCTPVPWTWGFAVVAIKDGGHSDWTGVSTRSQ